MQQTLMPPYNSRDSGWSLVYQWGCRPTGAGRGPQQLLDPCPVFQTLDTPLPPAHLGPTSPACSISRDPCWGMPGYGLAGWLRAACRPWALQSALNQHFPQAVSAPLASGSCLLALLPPPGMGPTPEARPWPQSLWDQLCGLQGSEEGSWPVGVSGLLPLLSPSHCNSCSSVPPSWRCPGSSASSPGNVPSPWW